MVIMRTHCYHFILTTLISTVCSFGPPDKDESLRCYHPLAYFTHCVSSEYKFRLQGILLEKNEHHRKRVQRCFDIHACSDLNLDADSVDVFLSGEWRTRVRTFLTLLESTPRDVQSCMLTYVKKIVQKQFQKCVRDFGPHTLENFTMPEIPGFDEFDVVSAKDVIQYRMMVRHGLIECVHSGQPVDNLISCIAGTRTLFAKSMCSVRNECKSAWMDSASCGNYFKNVHRAACDCRDEERAQLNQEGVFGYIHRLHALIKRFDTLNFESNYKLCFEQNNRTFPDDQYQVLKKVIVESVADVILFKKELPTEVKHTLKVAQGVLSNLGDTWKSSFCTKCLNETPKFDDTELNQLKLLVKQTKKTVERSKLKKTKYFKPSFYTVFKGITSFIRLT